MDPQLKARLNQQIAFQSYVGQTGAGVPSYAMATTIYGFVTGRRLFRTTKSGEEIYSEQTVYVDETYATLIQPKDQLTLPNGEVCLVQDTQIFYAANGPIDFGEVYL